eukprot:6631602-Prymnesium_polylepis.1
MRPCERASPGRRVAGRPQAASGRVARGRSGASSLDATPQRHRLTLARRARARPASATLTRTRWVVPSSTWAATVTARPT